MKSLERMQKQTGARDRVELEAKSGEVCRVFSYRFSSISEAIPQWVILPRYILRLSAFGPF